ncbi:hypothetical protein ACFV0R_13075 [Streptomyces sp. NPDC059578]|uniref:hypothetical protein n=1 Tax=unclassified Streptomyces TaxID=2593676 RepID=UPI00365C146D
MPKASDLPGDRGGGPTRRRTAAELHRRRVPRPRVEVTVNPLNGTVSWRTVSPGRPGSERGGRGRDDSRERPAETSAGRPTAAALRAAGLDPNRVPDQGAAPVPARPAAVRAVVGRGAEGLSPEQRSTELARVGLLRSRLVGDLSHGARMPSSVAARLRSTASPVGVHRLSAHAAALRAVPRTGGPGASNPALPSSGPSAAGPRR